MPDLDDQAETAELPHLPNLTLVVDGDLAVCDTIRLILESRGRKVETAYDGETGLACARRCRPDLIVMELHLRRLSGLELLVSLERDAATAGIPVMVLTDVTAKDPRPEADWRERLRVDAFLKKPVVLETFLEQALQAVDSGARRVKSA